MVGGRTCRCGARGCLEAYAGAGAILDRYGARCRHRPGIRAYRLIGMAATSARAREVLDETALYLGVSIGNLINLFNPERIILGGWAGLLLGERILPAIREAAREHSLRYPFAQTSIELGRLGPDAVALGAATLPIEALLGTMFAATKSDRPAS